MIKEQESVGKKAWGSLLSSTYGTWELSTQGYLPFQTDMFTFMNSFFCSERNKEVGTRQK